MTLLVLDTNVALDLLVFDDPSCMSLRAVIDAGTFEWIATQAMRDELVRVLGYPLIVPRLERGGRDAAQVLAAFDARVRLVDTPATASLPCEDADDQMFVDLAVAHRAQLISKDRAVLVMQKRLALLGVTVVPAFDATA
ncbi:PIN domain-containing protein [Variovorax sp. J22R133]|uniref:PIN domain-containing protein n=1 Tax=Variovorax brevis TaxID=3053503 RepID=UPI002578E0AB|nr:PIN domain-containing protein [Variovorax sp. J22R133]MDM0115579.1 PIN domain-containing protein [Variovorax sp. J22R133]